MSALVHKQLYLTLIERLLDGTLPTDMFREAVFDLLTQEEADCKAMVSSWPEPYQEQLYRAARERRISLAEFDQKRAELFGYADDRHFQRLVWDLEIICHSCSPEAIAGSGPRTPGERAQELRREVEHVWTVYNQKRTDEAPPAV